MGARFARTTRALAADGPRRAWLTWAVALLLAAGWVGWFVLGRVTVYEVSRQARVETAQAPRTVASLVSGRVAGVAVVLGQRVRAGDPLFELDAGAEILREREEQTRLAAIAPRLASLDREIAGLTRARAEEIEGWAAAGEAARSRVREAAAAVDFARDHEKRLREESAAGSVPKVDALRAAADTQKLAAARDALAAEVRRLQTEGRNRDLQQAARIEDLRRTRVTLEGEATTLTASLARLAQSIERHRVHAPSDGTIAEIAPQRAGAYVAEGEKLATVVPDGALLIVAQYEPAKVLGRIRAGQAAIVRLDGFPWAQYGTVRATVSRVAGEIRDATVRVELVPQAADGPTPVLQHGLPGTVEVAVDRMSPAVLALRTVGQVAARPARAEGGPAPRAAAR